jgi:hemin uptake protein HemP
MKTILISVLITLCFPQVILIAQNDNKSGLYLKVKDYKNGNLSYKIDCKTEKHTIKLHEFFNGSNIDIIHNGQKYTYRKDSVWGFEHVRIMNTGF